jgi:hypothetical protein
LVNESHSYSCYTTLIKRNFLWIAGEWIATQLENAGSGTVAAVILGEYLLITSDPGNIKAILATEFNNFGKGNSNCAQ